MSDRTLAIVAWTTVAVGLAAIAVCGGLILGMAQGFIAVFAVFGGGVL